MIDQSPGSNFHRPKGKVETEGFEGRVAIAVYRHSEVEHVEYAGADIVLEPFEDAADTTMERVLESLGRDREASEQREP